MKKIITILAAIIFMLQTSASFAKVKIVTTLSDLNAIVKEVGGDKVDSMHLAKPSDDPHQIEPKPTFLRNLSKADLLFLVGMDLEIWLQPLIDSSHNMKIQKGQNGYVDCSTVISPKEVPTTRVTPELGDVHPLGNPHYWLDPNNALLIAELAYNKLSQVDSSNEKYYAENLSRFKNKINEKIKIWKEKIGSVSNKKIVCQHSSWIYFTDFTGLEIVGYVESRPGIPPTAKEIMNITNLMNEKGCKCIICESYQNKKFPNMVASKIQGKVISLPASTGAVKGTETYILFIDYLINKLTEELK